MYRKYIKNLEEWLNSKDRKPLLIYGARQIGKTYLIKELFAEKYFPNKYIYIDCKIEKDFSNYVKDHVGSKDIISYIKLHWNKEVDSNTLLIFDEAQSCLPIITAMKYFCQDARDIPVIVTGSMVRIKIQRESNKPGPNNKNDFLFPIGKINILNMFPLNFEEYLINKNQNLYNIICDCYKQKIPLLPSSHQLALNILHEYLMVGGMPEAANNFILTHDSISTRKKIAEIYENYLGDMSNYQTSNESIARTMLIYKSIYEQLNKEQKNYKCSLIASGLRNRDLCGPIDWLQLANVVLKSKQLKQKVSTPLIAPLDSLYRLYLSDMGIFTYQSGIDQTTFINPNMQNTLSGIFFENYIAIELHNVGLELFYWKGKARGEFEFLTNNYDKLIPIDVKKSKGSMKSLEEFKKLNKTSIAIKVSANNYGFDQDRKILTIPIYMFFILAKDLINNKLPVDDKN